MRVLAVSPHLDDAVFSVGATLARLADAGHEVTVVTCFTASVPDPTGFALACQTDKGLPPEADYMDLRRDEDRAATAVLGARRCTCRCARRRTAATTAHRPCSPVSARTTSSGRTSFAALEPYDADLWLAPQGLGAHVDHLQVVRAVARLGRPTLWWRDAPYAVKAPDATPSPDLPAGWSRWRCRRTATAEVTRAPATSRSWASSSARGGDARGAAGLARAAARRPAALTVLGASVAGGPAGGGPVGGDRGG
jgi:LmbE family N-acetylglucosaminyl deacetylase